MSKAAKTSASAAAKPLHIHAVTKRFLASIEKDGLLHTLQWCESWFAEAAEAKVKDELDRALGPFSTDPEAVSLQLMTRLMNAASMASNRSTSVTANLMHDHEVSVMATMINRGPEYMGMSTARPGQPYQPSYGSATAVRKAFDEWHKKPKVVKYMEEQAALAAGQAAAKAA